MFGLTRQVRIGLAAVAALAATTAGLAAAQAQAPVAEAAQCYERFVSAPINEQGIQCPGDPTIWKSFTFASSGIGYYTETAAQANGRSQVRLGYRHDDSRVAISFLDCDANGCQETYWNGVPFPFQR